MSFTLVSAHDVASLIMNCPTKSSPLDPLPTFVLKECVSNLAPRIADIVNLSLTTGIFPHEMKLAYVTPFFKKNEKNFPTIDLCPFSLFCPNFWKVLLLSS